jgi:hypothetical protein
VIRAFFTELLTRDASGRSWLPGLLAAAPHGAHRFAEVLPYPGSVLSTLAVKTPQGGLAAFEHPVAPSRELLEWYVDHPDALRWPEGVELSAHTDRLRRALIFDQPPGARARAQSRAHELAPVRSSLSQEWWRFEEPTKPGCLLITDRVVVTVEELTGPPPPASDWYPPRSELIRDIESGLILAHDRIWGALVLSDEPLEEASDGAIAAVLPAAVPHLDQAERTELQEGYLGNLTWSAACDAVGLSLSALTDS